jgi:hypothetical protein
MAHGCWEVDQMGKQVSFVNMFPVTTWPVSALGS